jgi:hypothetical protein
VVLLPLRYVTAVTLAPEAAARGRSMPRVRVVLYRVRVAPSMRVGAAGGAVSD